MAVNLDLAGIVLKYHAQSDKILTGWYGPGSSLRQVKCREEVKVSANLIKFAETEEGWVLIGDWTGRLQGIFIPQHLLVEGEPAVKTRAKIIEACRTFKGVQRLDDGLTDEWDDHIVGYS